MKFYSLRSFLKDLSVPAGAILSGVAAGSAASALGHDDSSARYPFPDFWGIILSWSCLILAPLAALTIKAIANHFLAKRNPRIRLSGVVAMLVIAPLLGMTAGFIAQSKENYHSQITKEFYAAQKRAYNSLTIQIMADPQIALREKWYEKPTSENWSPELTARAMVFPDSFEPEHGPVPYTLAQLEELAQVSAEARFPVAYHPNCSAQLIEKVWPEVMGSRQAHAMEAIILNPSTPRVLLERYAKERNLSKNNYNGWIGDLVLERLDKEKSN